MAPPKAKRANRKTSAPSPREKKIAEIVRCMTQGVWGPAQARTYCEIWHISPTHMRDYAAEASRILRFLISQDKDEIRLVIAASLQHVAHEAAKDRKWGAVVQAIHAQADLWGVNAPQQIDVRTELMELSDEELAKREAELLKSVQATHISVNTHSGAN
jgi:hypothetical protein